MGFRGKYKNKRDGNEPEIIDELRAHGFSVYPMDQPLDLLVGFRGRTYLVEVKMPKAKLTKTQEEFLEGWRGDATILRTNEDVTTFAVAVREAGHTGAND